MARLLGEPAESGIAGGSVHDAPVAAAAREHRLPLATRDRRAAEAYRSSAARLELIG